MINEHINASLLPCQALNKTKSKKPKKNKSHYFNNFQIAKLTQDEDTARDWFEQVRWGKHGRVCGYCDSDNTIVAQNKSRPTQRYWCRSCRKYFSVRTNTVMQRSQLSHCVWLQAIYLLVHHPNGKTSHQLARDLGISQTAAWHLAHRIREGWADQDPILQGIVEVDETFVGGKEKNKHAIKKLRAGRGTVGKQPVVGGVQRGTDEEPYKQYVAQTVHTVDRKTLHQFIFKNVANGAIINTDENRAYPGMPHAAAHHTVNHSKSQYVDGTNHTNSIENFWSKFKTAIVGLYHYISPKHMDRYLKEFTGRLNEQRMTEMDQMKQLFTHMMGRQLRLADLTDKV